MYDVTVIGPSVIDILAAPFDPEALARGKRDMDQIRMSFGGDALNEAVVLTRLGKKVQLLSKIGADQAGRSIRKHLEKAGVSTENLIIQEGLSTSVNIALVDAVGGRKFLMDPRSSQRKLGLEDILPLNWDWRIFCPYWTRQRTLSHSPAFLFLPALLSLKWKSFLRS